MLTLFAHAGHVHGSTETMSAIDHCMPIIIGSGAIIVVLLGSIAYLLVKWQPKSQCEQPRKPQKASSNALQ